MRSSSDCAWRERKPIRIPKNALAQAPRVRLVCCLLFTLLGGQCSIGDMNCARESNGKRPRCKIPTWNAKRRTLQDVSMQFAAELEGHDTADLFLNWAQSDGQASGAAITKTCGPAQAAAHNTILKFLKENKNAFRDSDLRSCLATSSVLPQRISTWNWNRRFGRQPASPRRSDELPERSLLSLPELQKADIVAAVKNNDGEARVSQNGPEVWAPLRDLVILHEGEEGMGISFNRTLVAKTSAACGAEFARRLKRESDDYMPVASFGTRYKASIDVGLVKNVVASVMLAMQPATTKGRAIDEFNVQIVNEGVEWTQVLVTLLLVVLAGMSYYFRRVEIGKDAIMKKVIEESTARDKEVVRLKRANVELQTQLENALEEAQVSNSAWILERENLTERLADQEGEIRRHQETIRVFQHHGHQERGPPLPRHGPSIPPALEVATQTGRCVHLPGCHYLRSSQVRRYTPCSVCFPQ